MQVRVRILDVELRFRVWMTDTLAVVPLAWEVGIVSYRNDGGNPSAAFSEDRDLGTARLDGMA
jgi:hypothetical protein